VTEQEKANLTKSLGEMISKAITTAAPEKEEKKDEQTDVAEITKAVTEGVLTQLQANPVFKALEGVQKTEEPDEQAEMKKYVRQTVRKAVADALETAFPVIIEGVKKSVMEMFGGEDSIKKVNMIGSKLQVVSKKKGKAPVEDVDEDDDEDEDDGDDEPVQKKKRFKKRGEEDSSGGFGKKASLKQLDKGLGTRARGALK
jgi:hypothetical protein